MIKRFGIDGPLLLESRRFEDVRGFFSEVWKDSWLADLKVDTCFVQDNHSLSRAAGTIRGLHFQRPPSAQGKLVRCVHGAIFDVAVDLRRGSPTYGRHITAELSAENWRQLWIPRGFAHGLCTLTADAEVLYKVDAPYDAAADAAICWDDPAIGIEWPLNGSPVLSDKDRVAPHLVDFVPPEAW